MKKHITFLILLLGFLSHGQEPIIIYQNAPDRQKITEFEKRNDSLVISLENSGTNKVYIGDIAGVALGETSITAYRGDRGKTAYDHTSLSNNPHSVTKSQVGLGNVDNTSDANKPVSTLTQTALNAKANINSPTFTGNVIVPTATISDAAVNFGQMMDSLATVGTGLIQEIASTKTLTKEDAWIVYRNRSVGDSATYTIPNQVNGGFTEDIGYTFYTKTTGKIFVKGETGSGVEPVEISGAGQYATITRMGANTWDWSKGVLPWVTPVFPLDDPDFVASFWAEDLGDDESSVSLWPDRIGDNNAVQATGANQPKINIELDGKKAVDFDGIDDGLAITEVPALDFTPGDPISIVLVTGEKAFGSDQFPLFKGDTSSSTTGVEYGFYSTGASYLRGNIYGSVGTISGEQTGVDVYVAVSDGTTASFYLNGSIVGGPWNVGTADISSNIWIGNRLGGGKFFSGSIRAIGIANSELDSEQIETISNYAW